VVSYKTGQKNQAHTTVKKLSDLMRLLMPAQVLLSERLQFLFPIVRRYQPDSPDQLSYYHESGKYSPDLCDVIIQMLPLLDTSEIMAYTGASKSTIERVA